MDRPTLSVIIPTYNRSAYVRDCLRGLRACGLDDLELIVADDGSTDDTRDVVAATDPAAVYLWQPNSGTPSTARNLGFARSTGRYVAFLDCDDGWLPDAPARAVGLLDRHPDVAVLFADARMGNPEQGYVSWIESAGQAAFRALPHAAREPGFRVLDRGPFFRRMAERNPVFIGAVVLRRAAFARTDGFDPDLRGAADWDLWMRMAAGFTFAYMDEPLAVYSRHLDNMSSDQEHMVGEFCAALEKAEAIPGLPTDDRAWVAERRRTQMFYHAYIAYEAGRYAVARSRFRAAIRAGHASRAARLLYLICHLPGGVIRRLRRAKHAVSRPSRVRAAG